MRTAGVVKNTKQVRNNLKTPDDVDNVRSQDFGKKL